MELEEEVKTEATSEEEEELVIKTRWGIPRNLNSREFVGRDIIAVAHDLYIFFINLKTFTESVYVANSVESGDGVDCVTGHRSNVFAFAEKISPPRIFVCSYPSFSHITQILDPEVNRYKCLCMTEGDLIVGFSGFPNYVITVWSWRICQKLISVPTEIVRRNQIYLSSKTHSQIVESWGEGLIVWEIAQCYRQCMVMKRTKHPAGPGEDDFKIHDVCWTVEGFLYVIDNHANLYSVNSDGIGMVTKLEWIQSSRGGRTPYICGFAHGFIIYCPDGRLRSLKLVDSEWQVVWAYKPVGDIDSMLSNMTFDVAVLWTERGHIYRITGDAEDKLDIQLISYKQRNIIKMELIAPDCEYIATINNMAEICLYEVLTGKLVTIVDVESNDVQMQSSTVEPLLAVFGEVGSNYGVCLLKCPQLERVSKMCLTNQVVSRVCFSPTGRELVAAAMSAGHIFIFQIKQDYSLELVRYAEIGRGLADCFLAEVGLVMRCFSLVIFSDKYKIGERIVCINAETGKDNKFAGKMHGPYRKLLALSGKDTVLAIPHHSKQFHILKLTGEKGVTVQVKVDRIIESGHEIKCITGICNISGLLTFGADGLAILREPEGPDEFDLKVPVSHRYDSGVKHAALDRSSRQHMTVLGNNMTMTVHYLDDRLPDIQNAVQHEPIDEKFVTNVKRITIMERNDKNWLELQEEKRVKEETMDYRKKREEVVKTFKEIQRELVALLEENLQERALHQLPVSEFNLHLEAKRERLKQASEERESIRQHTAAKIAAQDKVTAWIKSYCWDTMLTPRMKLFAIFSHYMVENYAVLPTQRDNWPELQLAEHFRTIEMENDEHLFKPWLEQKAIEPVQSVRKILVRDREPSSKSVTSRAISEHFAPSEETLEPESYVLTGTLAHNYIKIPSFNIQQMMAYSFIQMHWLQDISKS